MEVFSILSLLSNLLFRRKSVIIILILVVLLSGVLVFFYVKSLRSQLQTAILEKNIAMQSLEESNKTIDILRQNIARQQQLLNDSRQNIRRIENQRAQLERELRNLDLQRKATMNPSETNKIIQQKLDSVFDRLENISR